MPKVGEVVGCGQQSWISPIGAPLLKINPNLIVNAAGYTVVDLAEDEHKGANAVNAEGQESWQKKQRRLGPR